MNKGDLYRTVADLIGVSKCNGDDNIFDIGANSLHIVRLSDILHQIYAIDISPIAIMSCATLGDLSRYIEEAIFSKATTTEHTRAVDRIHDDYDGINPQTKKISRNNTRTDEWIWGEL